MTYSIQGLRKALICGSLPNSVYYDILILVAFTAVLLPVSVKIFDYAIYRLRVSGRLSDA